MRPSLHLAAVTLFLSAFGACRAAAPPAGSDLKSFLENADATLLRLSNEANQAGFTQATFITPDTEAMSARASEAYAAAVTDFAKRAATFSTDSATPDQQRRLTVLKNSITMAAPSDPQESAELATLVASMDGAYGRGKYCPAGESPDKCLDIEAITRILASDRNPARLREVWEGWHTISPPFKPDYVRFVALSNKGAKELGFADTGAMWRSRYDMPPDDFSKEVDRLWQQLRPLYLSLHTYVRARLHAKYGDAVPADGPIPAHLLGNIWAQEWNNVYDLVAPAGAAATVSLDAILRARATTPVQMVQTGERFFTSLGFDPLPKTFWERSLFVKPRDRDVVCHASAWYVDNQEDVRIKMCIDPTAEDFTTIHHELGHDFYAREYNRAQPMIFRDSANDGFHEAIGDTIGLSVTPEYLVKIGLLDKAPPASSDVMLLLRQALDKVAFLPFSVVIDQWRWQVFSGQVPPDRYNAAWWELRERYQGVRAPSVRGEAFFDPGAKYHVPGNTPYARYFLSYVLQFQFHRALAKVAGCTSPLNRCSIYGSAEAGKRLKTVLAMGSSKPWPDALEALTGERQLDATAIADYFAPLKAWLDEQNKGSTTSSR
ncbi:MAG TPA: M2 family metallopeptidase [Vicinamibacterales bacterium]|nr:M2 family metallopeptidase [Vicinamibacterales bacterium]